MARPTKDLSGMKFGRLTALARDTAVKGKVVWNCLCSCGTACKGVARELLAGRKKSCGCDRRNEPTMGMIFRKEENGDVNVLDRKTKSILVTIPPEVQHKEDNLRGALIIAMETMALLREQESA